MFHKYPDTLIHFIGIGGIGMSGIAQVLLNLGYSVSGSDRGSNANTTKLANKGATIYLGHSANQLTNADVIVYSSAIDSKNPEMVEAQKRKIPLIKRAEMLAELMRLKFGLAVAGTHGKTTTTSFLATILFESGVDLTYIIGGIVKNLDNHAQVGKSDYLVAEADESDGSFLLLTPIMAVITNIDNDHLDFYKTSDNLFNAFLEFANKIPFYGCLALNIHDPLCIKIKEMMNRPYITFGIDNIYADVQAKNVTFPTGGSNFDLFIHDKFVSKIIITLSGRHNILNALGAIALAYKMDLPVEKISSAITRCHGVERRFQTLYQQNGLEIIDDYGHHPTEISTTIQTARQTRKNKLVVIFEPHRFTRTKSCWDQFLFCFSEADELYLTPIYPASETPLPGIDHHKLAKDINSPAQIICLENLDDNLDNVIKKYIKTNTTILSLGAGTIGKKVRDVIKKLPN